MFKIKLDEQYSNDKINILFNAAATMKKCQAGNGDDDDEARWVNVYSDRIHGGS